MPESSLLAINPALVEHACVRFLREELGRTGRSKVVLGLSGGVDSAVVAALAVRALGPDQVIAVLLPHQLSSPSSEADARAVAASLDLQPRRIDITLITDGFVAAVPDAGPHRLGNVMARARMIVLFDLSEAENALVLGTSNKSELLLGYGTLNGDLASALNPLGDLYKTQVWQLARHLGLPPAVIEKAPSADLWEGQSDEAELGFTYSAVDKILYHWVDNRASAAELASLGLDPELVTRVQRLVRTSQFKRQPPLICKLGARTLTTDFHHARDWGT